MQYLTLAGGLGVAMPMVVHWLQNSLSVSLLRNPPERKARKRQDVKKLNFSLESIKIDFVKLDWK
jgi:hypothetical protein